MPRKRCGSGQGIYTWSRALRVLTRVVQDLDHNKPDWLCSEPRLISKSMVSSQ